MLIAVVTPLFPINEEPYRGKPIYRTVLSLQRHADVKVFCPLAVYPPFLGPKYRYHRADLTYRPAGIDVEYFEYHVFPVMSRPINGRLCASHLAPRLAGLPFDLILSYWLYPDSYAAVSVAHQRKKPVVVGARGSDLRRLSDPLTRSLVTATLNHADRAITVSGELKQQAVALGVPPAKINVIRNGCDPTVFFHKEMSQVRQELLIPAEDRIILFVGWLDPAKGTVLLLKAFEKLAVEDRSLRLVFLGEGNFSHIQGFMRNSGLGARIRIMGPCSSPEVARWMNAADVLCLPSYSEGCPNVVLEATAVGCPVVASNIGGIPEVLSPELGTLTHDQAPETLAATLRSVLDQRWDREKISRSATRTWDQVGDDTFEVCRDVVARKTTRGIPPGRAVPKTGKRLKVVVVTPYFPIAEEPYRGHSAFHTLRHMQKYADIEVICPIAVYPRHKWLNPTGYRYLRPDLSYRPPELKATYFEYPALPFVTRPINGLTCAHYLKPYLEAAKPDVILNYWVYPEGFAAVHLGRKWGIPVVVGSIGSDILRTGDALSQKLVNYTLNKASGVVTVSEDLRRNVIALGVLPELVTTVLNGCDLSVFHPRDRAQQRREIGIEQDAELLLYVGWISPTKGLVELVESVGALAKRHPMLKLALVGEGYYLKELEKQAQAAGVKDRLLFLGRKTSAEVSQWMGACDVFCLPSHSEGCPNVIIEAIASGRPVVATHVGGIPELVHDGCGVLVAPHNTAALVEALDAVLAKPWDNQKIASQFSRGWEAAAVETFQACCRAGGFPILDSTLPHDYRTTTLKD